MKTEAVPDPISWQKKLSQVWPDILTKKLPQVWPDILTKKIAPSLTWYLDKKIAKVWPDISWQKKNCHKFDLISWQKKWHKFCKRLTASCQLPRTFTVILWEDNKLLYYCTSVLLYSWQLARTEIKLATRAPTHNGRVCNRIRGDIIILANNFILSFLQINNHGKSSETIWIKKE